MRTHPTGSEIDTNWGSKYCVHFFVKCEISNHDLILEMIEIFERQQMALQRSKFDLLLLHSVRNMQFEKLPIFSTFLLRLLIFRVKIFKPTNGRILEDFLRHAICDLQKEQLSKIGDIFIFSLFC